MKKPNLKLMSKHDIEKERIKSYNYIDMRTEQEKFIEEKGIVVFVKGVKQDMSEIISLLEQYTNINK